MIQIRRPISREMIRQKAIELFEGQGVANTSVNDIVKGAEIAKGTFYLYFKDRDELINDIFDSYNESFEKEVIMKNAENTRIKLFSASILEYFSLNRMFLTELRRNIYSDKEYKYINRTINLFSKVIISFININEEYPIKDMNAYANLLAGIIVEICYKAIVQKSLGSLGEAKVMLEDLFVRYFKC